MILIHCPYCEQDLPELEFAYAGEAHIARPADPSKLSDEEWRDFLFIRSNPKGVHFERWRHLNGCARFFNAARETVGDKFLEGDAPVLYSGVPVQPIPLFPENLGAGSDQTVILLCNPKNIHVGIWRQIRIESARDISEGTLKIVATLRFDVKFAEETGVAKAINVQL